MAQATCTVPGCDSPRVGWGYCNKHYRRLRRTGRLDKPSLEERFFAHVTEGPEGCWLFDCLTNSGYGQMSIDKVHVTAHVWAFEFFVVDVPTGLTLDHLCHSRDPSCPGGSTCPHRACVNPWHLEPVPHRTNILRGVGPPAVNARKTQCVDGHPFTSENTYLTPDGRRQCRKCMRRRSEQYQQRRS